MSDELKAETDLMSPEKKRLRDLFYGNTSESKIFNWALFWLNFAAIILFVIDQVHHEWANIVRVLDLAFGVVFALEYAARYYIAPKKAAFVFQWIAIIDIIVILSLFAPMLFGNFGFFRILRSLRLLRSYRLIESVTSKSRKLARYDDLIRSSINLAVFVFIMTDIVYVTQVNENANITSYIDAMYFTVTTLSTTGFGDITLVGPMGRFLSILIMIFGLTLFMKLARAVISPPRVYHECPRCGLQRHESDAVHCRHCGTILHMHDDGI